MLISIETHRACDFQVGGGGSGRHILPLDPHYFTLKLTNSSQANWYLNNKCFRFLKFSLYMSNSSGKLISDGYNASC